MLVRFSATGTGSITTFGGVAVQLIKMLGATGDVPGAIRSEDIPAALDRLQQQLRMSAAPSAELSNKAGRKVDEKDPEAIALATRAGPLIDILQRAIVANAPVMWEKI